MCQPKQDFLAQCADVQSSADISTSSHETLEHKKGVISGDENQSLECVPGLGATGVVVLDAVHAMLLVVPAEAIVPYQMC